jgi:hypothetical protein
VSTNLADKLQLTAHGIGRQRRFKKYKDKAYPPRHFDSQEIMQSGLLSLYLDDLSDMRKETDIRSDSIGLMVSAAVGLIKMQWYLGKRQEDRVWPLEPIMSGLLAL